MVLIRDSMVHKFVTGGFKRVLAYVPLLFAVAPFTPVTLGVLIVLVVVALALKYVVRVQLWISAIGGAAIMLAFQTYMLRDGAAQSYFVDCNRMTVSCAEIREVTILDQPVRIWPYNSQLPLLGNLKKLWFQAAAGEVRFDAFHLSAGENGLFSPLERQLFAYFGGDRQQDGVTIPYRLRLSRIAITTELGLTFDPTGTGQFNFGMGGRSNLPTQLLLPTPPVRQESELVFTAAGDALAPETWRRAVRNDLWLAALAGRHGGRLAADIRQDSSGRNRSEALLIDVIDLAAWCHMPDGLPAMIGCHARWRQLDDRLSRLASDVRSGTTNLVRTIMDVALEDADLHAVTANLEGLDDASAAPDLFGSHGATTRLVKAVTDRFGTHIDLPEKSAANSCASDFLKQNGWSRPADFDDAPARLPEAFLECSTEQVLSFLDGVLHQSTEGFERNLLAIREASRPLERRHQALVLLLHIEERLTEPGELDLWALLMRLTQIASSDQVETLLYNPIISQALTSALTRARTIELLHARREQVMTLIEDAPERVHSYLAGDPGFNMRERMENREILDFTEGLHGSLTAYYAAHPESSGSIEEDMRRLMAMPGLKAVRQQGVVVLSTFLKTMTDGFLPRQDELAEIACQADIDALALKLDTSLVDGMEDIDEPLDAFMSGVTDNLGNCGLEPLFDLAIGIRQQIEALPVLDPAHALDWLMNSRLLPDSGLIPKVGEIAPLTSRLDLADAYHVRLTRIYGDAALGLDLVDWDRVAVPEDVNDSYPTHPENFTSAHQRARELLCSLWDSQAPVQSSLFQDNRRWKQMALLLPLSNLERLCGDRGRSGIISASVRDLLGQEVIAAYRDRIVPPLDRRLLTAAALPRIAGAIGQGKSTTEQRLAFARLSLFNKEAELAGLPAASESFEDSELPEEVTRANKSLVYMMIAPWQEDELLGGPSRFLASAEHLLSSGDPAIRDAALGFLQDPTRSPLPVLQELWGGSDPADPTVRDVIWHFAELTRPLRNATAFEFAITLELDDPRPVDRALMVDILFDDDRLDTAAHQIMRLEAISIEQRSAWMERFREALTDDGGEVAEFVSEPVYGALERLRE